MCIAIVKPKGTTITDKELKNCFKRNPDGSGIAYTKNNRIYIIKGLFEVNEFVKAVRYAEKEAENNILIHCRIGTSGLKDKENCHPHIVNNNTVLIHNGILNITVPNDSNVSDTIIFINEYMKNLPIDFAKNKNIVNLIEKAIGNNNKFCLLNNKGEYVIINEKAGNWHNGIWFSNYSYKEPEQHFQLNFSNSNYYYNNYYYDDDWYEYCDKNIKNNLLSKRKVKKLKKYIRNLSDDEFRKIGDFPLYNHETGKLEEYFDNFDTNKYSMLDEISTDAYEEYMYELDSRDYNYSFYDEKENEIA